MRTYIPLNDNGQRAKALLAPILDNFKQYRDIRQRMAQIADQPTDVWVDADTGMAVFARSLQIAEQHLTAKMRRNERCIARSEALTPAQVMILTLRYVRGHGWPAIAEAAQMSRARLYQEHRVGLNGIDLSKWEA